jgi:hypothetical protein
VSLRRRLGLLAAVAALALVGLVVARRIGAGPPAPSRVEAVTSPEHRQPAVAWPAAVAPAASPPASPPLPTRAADSTSDPLTPAGAARALEAIAKNEQTRLLFARLQPLGLSRPQRDKLLVILGTLASSPATESPTLASLRANGRSLALSADDSARIRDERQRIADQTLRSLRPALAAVLTPAQLAQAGLSSDGPGNRNEAVANSALRR